MTAASTIDRLAERRRLNFRQRPDLGVRTLDEAARFIDCVGLALLFPTGWTESLPAGRPRERRPERRVLLPSLWEAHVGGAEPLVEWDERASQVWHWRDELSEARLAFYGKYLAGRASFVSGEMMPLLIAAGAGVPDEADLEAQYEQGAVRRELLLTIRAISRQGAIGSAALKRATGLSSARLSREVEELERRFLVLRVGSRREGGRRWPSNYYDLLSRAFPEVVAAASEYDAREASRQVAERYLGAAVFARRDDLALAVGWPLAQADRALGDLVAARRARPAQAREGLPAGSIVALTPEP